MRLVESPNQVPDDEEWVSVRLTALSFVERLLEGDDDARNYARFDPEDSNDLYWLFVAAAGMCQTLLRNASGVDLPELLQRWREQIIRDGLTGDGPAT